MVPARGIPRPAGRWRFLALALLLASPFAAAQPGFGGETLVVPRGTLRPGDVVALGRPLEIDGDVAGAAIATFGGVRVTGRVTGHLVSIGGDVVLAGHGRVDGDVLAVGGAVRFVGPASAGSSVGGSVRSLDALETAYVSELKTSPLAGASVSPLLVSFRLFLLLLWLVISLALLRLGPRALGKAASAIPGRLVLLGAVGAGAVLAGTLFSAGLLLLLPARPGLWLVLAVVMLLFVAKLLGLAALFLAVGRRLLRGERRNGAFFGDPAALTAGLLVLGLLSLVPVLGPILWGLASVVAIGLALRTAVVRDAAAGLPSAAAEVA
ncbi:MAG: hypothetical protein ACM3JH_02585 [Acidithiobacillales bacterium]